MQDDGEEEEEEEMKMEELHLKKSRSSASLSPAEVCDPLLTSSYSDTQCN